MGTKAHLEHLEAPQVVVGRPDDVGPRPYSSYSNANTDLGALQVSMEELARPVNGQREAPNLVVALKENNDVTMT